MIYMKLGSDVAAPSTGNTLAEVTLKQWLLEADGGYRVKPWLDVAGGAPSADHRGRTHA